jgi:hypothetical protein
VEKKNHASRSEKLELLDGCEVLLGGGAFPPIAMGQERQKMAQGNAKTNTKDNKATVLTVRHNRWDLSLRDKVNRGIKGHLLGHASKNRFKGLVAR